METSITKETLVKDVQKLKDDTSQLKTDAVQIAQDVRSHANAHVDEARQRVTDTISAVRQTFAAHPLYLISTVFAIGLLFGARFRR